MGVSERAERWPARLRLDPTVFVAPGAVVVGEVSIGARASVWFNTVVRGDTAPIEVGEDTNLQDQVTVHVDEDQPALVGARVTVGHRAIVHGCVIGDECLIGMGAIVLSGARVGAGSLVGAGALVREGQEIPPGSLALGAPARVMGPVTEAHRDGIRRGAAHYVALSRAYLARGFARPHTPLSSETGHAAGGRGPMSFFEWGQLLAILAESPDWMAGRLSRHGEADFRRPPAPGRWSALEVLCHLRDADGEVYLPRLERVLSETSPGIADVDMTGWDVERRYREGEPQRALESWRGLRARLLGRLAPLGRAEWERIAFHSVRGPFPLADMVRAWVEHDLSHRRQAGLALGDPA